jgi:cysteine-rich repeat protein
MRRDRLRLSVVGAGLGLALLGTTCSSTRTQSGLTGLDLTVRWAPSVSLDQLAIAGVQGGAPAFAPITVPDPPRPLAPQNESLVVLLPDSLAGDSVFVRIDGCAQSRVQASGAATVQLTKGQVAKLDITLGDPAVCGDGQITAGVEQCGDGNTRDGDGCSSICSIEPGWTCSGTPSTCTRTDGGTPQADAGTGGQHDAGAADTAPACTVSCDRTTSDNCTGSTCRCGSGPVCGSGARCVLGACRCDATSCPNGCCNGSVCLPGNSNDACGSGGASCQACTGDARCTGHQCRAH